MAVKYFLLLILHAYQVSAYGSGSPLSTCFTQYPKHGVGTQTSPNPFIVTFNPTSYRPGEDVTIQVTDSTGAQFVGIQMAARRMQGNTEEIVGRFVEFPAAKTKTYNCYGGYQNIVTHSNNNPVSSLTFKWRPPSDNVGDVTFITTFVRSYQEFWHETKTDLAVDSTSPVEPSTYPAIPLGTQTTSIDFDACGDSKGCFYYPRQCSGSDCKVAATYQYRSATKDFLFELHLNEKDDYVAIGFSHDEWMGKDVTVTCTGRSGQMSVQEGWNPGRWNERYFNLYSSHHEVMYSNGKLQCRFVLPETFGVYSIDQGTTDSFKFSETSWNLKKEWYLFLAWGATMPDDDSIAHHHDLPVISSSKVDLTEKIIIFTSTFHTLVQVHATLMIIAWVLFAGIVTVISRHYRDWMPKSMICGAQVWFQVHRTLAILVAMLTVTGIIVIFAHYGTGIRDLAKPHAYVGLAVVGVVGLQVIAGALRPDKDHSLRPLFNVGHRFTGHAAHILAAATMFLAYEIDYITSDMQQFGFITLGVWVGVQVIWHVVFEVIKRRNSSPDKSNAYAMDGPELKTSGGDKEHNDCPQTTTLVVYIFTLMGLCAAAILPVYLY